MFTKKTLYLDRIRVKQRECPAALYSMLYLNGKNKGFLKPDLEQGDFESDVLPIFILKFWGVLVFLGTC